MMGLQAGRRFVAEILAVLYMRIYTVFPNLIEVLTKYLNQNDLEDFEKLLEILEPIPSMVNDQKVVIEDELRGAFKMHFHNSVQIDVINMLNETVTSLDEFHRMKPGVKYLVLKLFEEWVPEDSNIGVKSHIHTTGLIQICLSELSQSVKGQNSSGQASRCLVNLMLVCDKFADFKDLYQSIYTGLYEDRNNLKEMVEENMAEELEAYLDVYNVFTVNAVDFMVEFPESNETKFIFYHVLLDLYKRPDAGLSSRISASFISVLRKFSPDEDQEVIDMVLDRKKKKFVELNQSLFIDLILVSIGHCVYSVEHAGYCEKNELYSDRYMNVFDDKVETRKECKLLLVKISQVMEFHNVFSQVFPRLIEIKEQVDKMTQDPVQIMKLESVLYCMSKLMSGLKIGVVKDRECVYRLVETVLKIKPNCLVLMYTMIDIISKSSPYLEERYIN